MKIAQVAPPWFPIPPKNYGGSEQVIANLVNELVAQGHDVTLFAPGDAKTAGKLVSFFPKSLREQGVPWSDHLLAYYHLTRALEQAREFDIVHTHLSSASDLYIFPLSANLQTPHVTTLHSNFPFDRVQQWRGEADDVFLKQWGEDVPVVAISKHAAHEVPTGVHIIEVVYNGIATQEIVPTKRKREDYLAWLGRFVPEKGPHLAVEAAKRVQRPIVLAGTVDRHQQDSVRYFNEVMKPLLDDKQVQYIGPVNQRRKISLLSRAYGFLNPIEWEEPFGMVMIEAMALGCPVISFARGAAPEIVRDAQTGFLVRDLDGMVARIPDLAEIDRQQTREYVEQTFSARVMAERYVEVYHQVIAKKKAGDRQPIHR